VVFQLIHFLSHPHTDMTKTES